MRPWYLLDDPDPELPVLDAMGLPGEPANDTAQIDASLLDSESRLRGAALSESTSWGKISVATRPGACHARQRDAAASYGRDASTGRSNENMTRSVQPGAATVLTKRAPGKISKKKFTALEIIRAHRDGGADAIAGLCKPLPDEAIARLAETFDGRAFAPWQQTAPRARYARCGTCGEIHHYGLATSAHQTRHTRERAAKRILAAEIFRRQEALAASIGGAQ